MSFWRNIAKIIGQEIAKELSKVPAPEHEARALYEVYTVDLSQARAKKEMPWGGDYLLVEYIDGELDVRLNRQDADAIELDKMVFVASDFDKVYLSNSAQSGKSAKVYVGKQMGFSAQVGMKAVGYTLEEMVFRGGDDTEVSAKSVYYELVKTITIYNVPSTKKVESLLYEEKSENPGSGMPSIKITVDSSGQSPVDEEIHDINEASYTFRTKTFSQGYYGDWVRVRIYIGVNALYYGYNRVCKAYGTDYITMRYI